MKSKWCRTGVNESLPPWSANQQYFLLKMLPNFRHDFMTLIHISGLSWWQSYFILGLALFLVNSEIEIVKPDKKNTSIPFYGLPLISPLFFLCIIDQFKFKFIFSENLMHLILKLSLKHFNLTKVLKKIILRSLLRLLLWAAKQVRRRA